jgi:hypothetical protein
MHLALAPRRRLQASYGPAAPELLAALAMALAAREAAGVATLAYDPEEGLADLGVPPAPLEPAALGAQIGAAQEALLRRGAIIESLWIVGGPGAVPFASLPNPMPDHDGPLLTDAPYALASLAEPLGRWPVGRTPDADPPAQGLLPALLRQVAAAHSAGPRATGATLALSAARWAAVTAQVIADIPEAVLRLAPPHLASSKEARSLEAARLIYGNLHGVHSGDAWYGQPPADTELVPALRPAHLAGLRLDGAVVISQACFGARLAPVGETPSLAPALLATGVSGLVGSLGLTYGAPDPPPGESDLLAQALLKALQAPGTRLGDALLSAQAATLRDVLRRRGAPDGDDLKTLLGFVLYGDPALLVT